MHSNVCILKNIGCTAPDLHPTDSITGNHPCPRLWEVRDKQGPYMAPWERESFIVLAQIPPALDSRNLFPKQFSGEGK